MRYFARLLNADGKPMHAPWGELQPLTLSWTALGGCDEAFLRLEESSMDIAWWQGYLGYPVEVYDDAGGLRWWGWLEAVQDQRPGMALTFDLASMANRVAVAYASQEPGDGFGTLRQTPWADDLESQALYGIKEHLVQAGSLSDEQAGHWRDILLSRMRLPTLQAKPSAVANKRSLRLKCKGWIHRLDWRIWQRESGVIGNAVAQSGVQAIGDSSERTHVAQSFKVNRTVLLNALTLRLRKQGLPNDQLRVDIRGDQGGAPSSSTLATCFIKPTDLADQNYAWVTGAFVSQINLVAGTTYWFVLSRSGLTSSTAYYWIGLDENLSFVDGQLKTLRASDSSWQPRVPLADALFKLSTLSRVDDEILAMLSLTETIFSGFSLESPTGLRLPAKANAGEPLFQALRRLLDLGNVDGKRYFVDVSPERFLRLYLEPDVNAKPFTMHDSGLILDMMGRIIDEKSQLVAKRVATSHQSSFLVSDASLDLLTGIYKLK